MKFQEQIENLELLIKHWDDIKTHFDFNKIFKQDYQLSSLGVCNNCNFITLPLSLKEDMISSWEHYSGIYLYPIAGPDEYNDLEIITDNPLRLSFAKHCLKYLKEFSE